eukprot:3456934-Pleurochrysis_carterae.AAC.6
MCVRVCACLRVPGVFGAAVLALCVLTDGALACGCGDGVVRLYRGESQAATVEARAVVRGLAALPDAAFAQARRPYPTCPCSMPRPPSSFTAEPVAARVATAAGASALLCLWAVRVSCLEVQRELRRGLEGGLLSCTSTRQKRLDVSSGAD